MKQYQIIAIVLIIAAAFSGYVFVQYQKMENESGNPSILNPHTNTTPRSTASTTPSTITVPADWKTYRNEKYGFEFDYPTTFIAQESGPSNYDIEEVGFKEPGGSIAIFVGISTPASIKEYDASCSPGTECFVFQPLTCENKISIKSCSEYYYAVLGGFWGKKGVIKRKDIRAEFLLYFDFDKKTVPVLEDKTFQQLAEQGKLSQSSQRGAYAFDKIFHSFRFVK